MTEVQKRKKRVEEEMVRAQDSVQHIAELCLPLVNLINLPRLTHRREHLWLGRAMEGAPI